MSDERNIALELEEEGRRIMASKSLQHSLASMTRWSRVDPDERSRRMTELSAKAAAARKKKAVARRAELEARGEWPPKRAPKKDDRPPIQERIAEARAAWEAEKAWQIEQGLRPKSRRNRRS